MERDGQTDRIDKLAGGCVCCHGSLGSHLEDSVAELLRRPDHDRFILCGAISLEHVLLYQNIVEPCYLLSMLPYASKMPLVLA